jgi:hypothetical protein
MYKILFFICFFTGIVFAAKAQKPDTTVAKSKGDSTIQKRDTVPQKKYVPPITKGKVYHPDSTHDPKKALFRSGVIPGWGRLYNHRWWKVPFIYGGLGLLVDVVVYNEKYYKLFLKEAQLREKGISAGRNPDFAQISDTDVINDLDAFRRDRDLGILGFIGGWGIQMIDAYIDAKFQQRFTMDNNLSIKVKPGIINQQLYGYTSIGNVVPGITVTFTFR